MTFHIFFILYILIVGDGSNERRFVSKKHTFCFDELVQHWVNKDGSHTVQLLNLKHGESGMVMSSV